MKNVLAILFVIQAALLCQLATADDWQHWRGNARNDITAEHSGWDGTQWKLGNPVWEMQTGVGASSPIVVDKLLYLFSWQDGKDMLTCHELSTSKLVWRQSFDAPKYSRYSDGDKGLYGGPCGTPEYDATTKYLYTFSNDGELRCWNTTNAGELVWRKNVFDEYANEMRPKIGRSLRRDYGYTSAPVVYNEWLLVEVGSAGAGNVIAFDKRTGAEAWRSESKESAGQSSSPVLMTIESVPCLAVFSVHGLIVMRLDAGHEGKSIGMFPWETDYANNVATPAVSGNSIVITSAYNKKAMSRLDVTLSGIKEVWQAPVCSGVCSPVLSGGNVFWAFNGLHCLDFETGNIRWTGDTSRECGSCIVTSDGKLITLVDRGRLILVDALAKQVNAFPILAERAALKGESEAWPHLILAQNHLIVRNIVGQMVAFRIESSK